MADRSAIHRLPPRRAARPGLAPLLLLLLVLLIPVSGAPAPAGATVSAGGDPSPLRLVVNIPALRLDVYENGALAASYPVTVGKPSDPTPEGHYRLQRVVWNPWWHPPFNRRPMDRVTPPGPQNPMGKVKLFFTHMYYLHGTPKLHEIGVPASRGCVRLRNADAVALALLVHRHAVAPLPAAKLDELTSTRSWRTHEYPLVGDVQIDLLYQLAEVGSDGVLHVYPDFYHEATLPLPELAARAVVAAGHPRELVDLQALVAAIGTAPEAPLSLPVADLLLAEDGADTAVAGISTGNEGSKPLP
ncbi:MAG TPA: L,D-transpeptidase [Thermoanaerobaculia bacterium]|jgi:hypothetical protein|nr:L,D-transpeptidase [Thermoanaerobaculia bacterium]